MSYIGQKIKQVFPDIVILKDQDNYSVFNGGTCPHLLRTFLSESILAMLMIILSSDCSVVL
jgi:hypothetical protein